MFSAVLLGALQTKSKKPSHDGFFVFVRQDYF